MLDCLEGGLGEQKERLAFLQHRCCTTLIPPCVFRGDIPGAPRRARRMYPTREA